MLLVNIITQRTGEWFVGVVIAFKVLLCTTKVYVQLKVHEVHNTQFVTDIIYMATTKCVLNVCHLND